MIVQALIEGIGIGIGMAIIVFLPSRIFPAKPKDSLLANLKQLEIRNKLLEENNSILRIISSCAVDAKVRATKQDAKAEKEAAKHAAATMEEDPPVSLREAADRPAGTISRIHQYDAKACCDAIARKEDA